MSKEIWLPEATLKVSVMDGKVKVWDEMSMYVKPLGTPMGFKEAPSIPEPAGRHVYRP